ASSGLTELVKQHYVIPAEMGSIKGAESYQLQISNQTPFDTVLLGMGEDGHTASLFPGHDWINAESDQLALAVHGAPKAPPERISLSLSALQNCRQMLVLITGESKRDAVKQWLQGSRLPVAEVADIEQATIYIEADLMR
ncbi:MAG: 6-phosphogluconolactonase, partial [Gammaproteobacteria bacterium]|nr:6-phosphogluconolactonase [Gammaproteobacteria bacterium]